MARPRLLLAASVAAGATAVGALAMAGPMGILEMRAYDLLVEPSGPSSASDRIAVVAVDDPSIAAIGQWPWPRDVVARLVDRLRELGAAVVALDVLFPEPDRYAHEPGGPRMPTDTTLVGSLKGGRVVLGYAFVFDEAGSPNPCTPTPLQAALVTPPGQRSAEERLFHPTGALCSLEILTEAAQSAGFLNIGVDADGMLRRLPLVMKRDGHVYSALALSAVLAALGSPPVSMSARRDGALHLALGSHGITLDEQGTLGLRFRAEDQAFAHIPAADVLNGRLAPNALDNRIVFVGATALGVRDAVPTPVRARHPGIEVHATAAENLLAGTYIVMPSYRRGLEALTGVLLALLAAFAVGRLGVRQGAAAIAVLVVTCWAASAWLLQQASVFLSPVVPSAIVLVSFAAVALTGLEFERRRADGERHRRRQAHEFVVKSLTSLMEMRDVSTGQHSRRTQGYSRLLAQGLASSAEFRDFLTPERVELISLLAPLHDIGKVGIRDAILNKPSPLTAEEMAEMKLHPVYGFETISQTQQQVGIDAGQDAAVLQLAKDIVYTHHERWDGEGYPRGLKGADIPVPGRIMAVVDVYDALVEPRPYRRRLSHDEAVTLIVAGRGTQFDPRVVEAFLAVSREFFDLGARLRGMSSALPG